MTIDQAINMIAKYLRKDKAGEINATFITARDELSRDIAALLARAGAQLKAA